jgi:hypothetical protein
LEFEKVYIAKSENEKALDSDGPLGRVPQHIEKKTANEDDTPSFNCPLPSTLPVFSFERR